MSVYLIIISSTRGPHSWVQHQKTNSSTHPSVFCQFFFVLNWGLFGVELRGLWCGTEGCAELKVVWNWGMCRIEECVELRGFWCGTQRCVELRGFWCRTERFLGLKRSAPFVSNWGAVEPRGAQFCVIIKCIHMYS